MGDESEVQNLLGTEAFQFTYQDFDGGQASVSKAFEGGASLTQVAEVFRRFLLSAGYSVKEVVIKSECAEFSSEHDFY